MTDISEIWRFDLRVGKSKSPREGACMMDAVSWFEYGTLGDHPACVCPVIAVFCRGINDALPDAERQQLKTYIPRVIGTRDTLEVERQRAEYLAWHVIRVFAPLALDAAGLHEHASRLRACSGTLSDAARAADAAAWAARAAWAAWAAWAATAAAREARGAAREARGAARAADAAARAADAAAWAAAAARADAAARAADAAARAADAAAWAARAALADAARAADAAARAAARAQVYPAMLSALEGVLAIGRQAPYFDLVRAAVAAERFAAEAAA